jgi:hypothetical protein
LDGIKSQQLAISEFISGYGTYAEIQARAGLAKHQITRAGINLIDN